MNVGVALPSRGPQASPENLATVARWAEELGYDSVWVSDRAILPEQVDSWYPYEADHRWQYPADIPWMDPLLALGWAAAATSRVKLGTAVLVAPLRHPVLLAKQVATLDYLSGGRIILGLGVGWMKEEFDLVEAAFTQRGKRAAEMVALMRALWGGETVDFEGDFFQVRGCQMHPAPAQSSIPIVWGGHSEAALRRVAQVGDGWLPLLLSFDDLTSRLKKLTDFCREYDRDPSSLRVIVAPEDAHPVSAETLERYQTLGIRHLLIRPPWSGTDLTDCRHEMERTADICGLQGQNA